MSPTHNGSGRLRTIALCLCALSLNALANAEESPIRRDRAGKGQTATGIDARRGSAGAVTEEVRGLWVARYSLSSPRAIRNIVANAKSHHFNTLFVQARGRGDAWYRSPLEPRAEALADQPVDFDPLDMVIAEAHRNDLKVHVWMNVFLTWSGPKPPRAPQHVINAHPDWIARDRDNRCSPIDSGNTEGLFLQPSHPEVREHLYRVFTDVVRRYDVDGLHFDFVRYPNAGYDFSDGTLARFKAALEPKLSDAGRDAVAADRSRLAWVHVFPKEWARWRREQVTTLVSRICTAVHTMKPWVQTSAAVFANVEDAFDDKGQDWRTWLADGQLDAVCPMAYSPNTDTVVKQIRQAVTAAGGRHVYAGLGSWRLSPADTAAKIARVRATGAQGIVLFDYDEITADGRSNRYLDYLSRGTFASRAGVPQMRWRDSRRTGPQP